MLGSKTHPLALSASIVVLASLGGCSSSASSQSAPSPSGPDGGAPAPLDGGSLVDSSVQSPDASPDASPDTSPNASPDASPVSSGGLSLRVSGNQLLDGNSKPVRLLGVNHSSGEYMCIQNGTPTSRGRGIFEGPTDLAAAQAIASWHATAVRVPLNEDCWLGVNDVNPAYGGASYQTAVADYVSTLHQAGLYVILDLHLTAPGAIPAEDQQAMPDVDHSIDFWKSVAARFASDPAVVFDLFNEPYPFQNYMQNSNGDLWDCWLNGCGINMYTTGGTPYMLPLAWNAVGMQALVDAVRSTGAKNPIMVGGIRWANDLSGWLAHKPNDPANQLIASWHSYPDGCADDTCRNALIAPVAAQVPVVIGETGDNVCTATTLIDGLAPWADAHGVSYLGWTWNTWQDCQNVLIKDYSGTPTSNYGQKFHDLLKSSNP